MSESDALAVEIPVTVSRQPRDDELDLFGLTHPGMVRTENQDQFLICTVHRQVVLHGTSLPDADELPLRGERIATVLLVADGVGGTTGGREASAVATKAVSRYVSSTLNCYHTAGASADEEFFDALRAAALEAHAAVLAEGRGATRMATTLTLAVVVWPWAYVTQIGDSRCYHFRDGVLQQVTRDQTMGQALVDLGALAADEVASSPMHHVLTSAIGGREATPVVTRMALARDSVLLLCSDGLTKHVSDAEIAEQLRTMQSSAQVCRALVQLALDRGGSDNITVIARQARAAS